MWNITIRVGEQILEVVVPGEIAGTLEITASPGLTGSAIVRKTRPPGLVKSKQFRSLVQETPYFDEYAQRIFAGRITASDLGPG